MSDTSKEFTVTITSPDERLWEGQAHSITTENSKGPFDILPGHANFITMIKGKPLTIRTGGKPYQIFNYKSFVLAVNSGKVSIYANI